MYGVCTGFLVQGFQTIDAFSDNVEHASFDLFAGGHGYGCSGRVNLQSSRESVGIVHGNGAYRVLTDMLLYFNDNISAIRMLHDKRIMDFGKNIFCRLSFCREAYIDYRTDNLQDMTNVLLSHLYI